MKSVAGEMCAHSNPSIHVPLGERGRKGEERRGKPAGTACVCANRSVPEFVSVGIRDDETKMEDE